MHFLATVVSCLWIVATLTLFTYDFYEKPAPITALSTVEKRQTTRPHRKLKEEDDAGVKRFYIPPPKDRFTRNCFTMDSFLAGNGVDLAGFGFESETDDDVTDDVGSVSSAEQHIVLNHGYFELLDDFHISAHIQGNETWDDLVWIRHDLRRPSISFYGDKVASKRWMEAVGIPTPKSYVLRYKHEFPQQHSPRVMASELQQKLLPHKTSFVAKPSHQADSNGIWLVRHVSLYLLIYVICSLLLLTSNYNLFAF
jgi:hypothetical protein